MPDWRGTASELIHVPDHRSTPRIQVDTIEQALIDATSVASPVGPVGYLIGYAIAADQLRNGASVVGRLGQPTCCDQGCLA
jgi:hypothetical protein